MATVYAYGRVSTPRQHDTGNSITHQKKRCRSYYLSIQDTGQFGDLSWGGFYEDGKGTSARKTEFAQRPGGKKLLAMMQEDDILVVDKVDRIWRNNHDFARLWEYFEIQGIRLHIVNLGGDSVRMGTMVGDIFLRMLVCFAELESRQNSVRQCEANQARREAGIWQGTNAPKGFKAVRCRDGQKRLVPDPEVQALMREVVELREKDKLSWERISVEMEIRAFQREGAAVPPLEKIRSAFYKRRFQKHQCQKLYYSYKGFQGVDPNRVRAGDVVSKTDRALKQGQSINDMARERRKNRSRRLMKTKLA